MAPIFKTSNGLPLSVYIEPSSPNRPLLHKTIMSNGGASILRIDKAHVVVVDAQSRKGRACAREQLALNPERIVLFAEWVEACVTAGKLLDDELDWGNLRIEEALDESLYEDEANDSKASAAHVKEDIKKEEPVDVKNHRPWPTPTSPTHLAQGELPVTSGVQSSTTATPPRPKTESFDSVPGPSHYSESHQPTPEPQHSGRLSPPKASSPFIPTYGEPPIEPEYKNLFLSACEEWENVKKEAATYIHPLKRRSQSFGGRVSMDRLSTKSPRRDISQEHRTRSPEGGPSLYQPLAKKRRPPLPHGSTKRGPKRRVSETLTDEFSSSQLFLSGSSSQAMEVGPADDSDDIYEILPPHLQTQPPSSVSQDPNKLFTKSMGQPMLFLLQTDLPNRGTIIKSLRKHGGETTANMQDASYIIISKSTLQYQETVRDAEIVNRPAVPVAWISRCIEENRIVSSEGFAVNAGPKVVGTLTEEDIITAALADNPPDPAPHSTWVKSKTLGYKFTIADQEYFQKYLAWTYARDPGFLYTDLARSLANNSPNHSFSSWSNFYYRSSDVNNFIMHIVDALKS